MPRVFEQLTMVEHCDFKGEIRKQFVPVVLPTEDLNLKIESSLNEADVLFSFFKFLTNIRPGSYFDTHSGSVRIIKP